MTFFPCPLCLCFADAKDVQIRDHLRKVDSLEETCLDLEGTIGQFRDLVLQLQRFVLLSWESPRFINSDGLTT